MSKTNAKSLRNSDGMELTQRFAKRQPVLRMQSGGEQMSWQQQTDLQNARTGANSIVQGASQQAAAAEVKRLTNPNVQVPTGPGMDRAGFLARNPNVQQGGAGTSRPGEPNISNAPYPERANATRYPAPTGMPSPTTPPAAGPGVPMVGNTGVFKHGSNTFSDSATAPVWSNAGRPSAAVSTLMDSAAQRSGQAPAGWSGQNLGFMPSGSAPSLRPNLAVGGTVPDSGSGNMMGQPTGRGNMSWGTATYPDAESARKSGADMLGLRDGGDLRTGSGGAVPGSGTGDKIPAKYEPGEFVVSNDMLDAQPELRQHLRSLREAVLAEKGMTVAEADAKAVNGGKGLRAEVGLEELIPGQTRRAPAYDGSMDGFVNTDAGRNIGNNVVALGGLGRLAGSAVASTGRISSAIKGAGTAVDAAAPALFAARTGTGPGQTGNTRAPTPAPKLTIAGDATMPGQDPGRPQLREQAPAVDWAARKAERDDQTLRDMATGDRMESRRLGQEAAGYAAQAQPQHLGTQWEREKDAWNAKVSASSTMSGLSGRARTAAEANATQLAAQRMQSETSLRTTGMNNDTSVKTTGMNNDTSLKTNDTTNRTALRGQDMDYERAMAPIKLQAQMRRYSADIFKAAGGDNAKAAQMMQAAGLDPKQFLEVQKSELDNSTSQQAQLKAARESGKDRFKGVFVKQGKDGEERDELGEARAESMLNQLTGGQFAQMGEAEQQTAHKQAVDLANMFGQIQTPQLRGFNKLGNQLGVVNDPVGLSAMPNFKGGTMVRRGLGMTYGADAGSWDVTDANGNVHNFKNLEKSQIEMLRKLGVN